jgi:inner membrane protein involved in colicin E2 resistance
MSIYSQLQSNNLTNVLNNDFLIDKTDYEKEKINQQYNTLYFNSFKDTMDLEKEKSSTVIYNLSIKDIAQNLSKVLFQIINELTVLHHNNNSNVREYIEVFIKDDRLIYTGILFILLGLAVFFIFNSS